MAGVGSDDDSEDDVVETPLPRVQTPFFATQISRMDSVDDPMSSLFALSAQVSAPSFVDDGLSSLYALSVQVAVRMDVNNLGQVMPAGYTEGVEEPQMIYSDIIFPECISYGSTGVPLYSTDKVEVASGDEARNSRHEFPKHQYNINMENLNASEVADVMNIWHVCSGDFAAFLFMDPMDHTSNNSETLLSGTDVEPTDQFVALAQGGTYKYPLYKFYTKASRTKRRRIKYPKEGTLRVAVDGFEVYNWIYSYTDCKLTFSTPMNGSLDVDMFPGGIIRTHDAAPAFAEVQVGDLFYMNGWATSAYNVPSGQPVRVTQVSLDGTEIHVQYYDESGFGATAETDVAVTFVSTPPPANATITAGFWFYVPVRFEEGDSGESEIQAGLRETVVASFDNIVLREVFDE